MCVLLVLLAVPLAGCCQSYDIPPQEQFKSLDEHAESDQAVVRVYGAPIRYLERVAIHTWIVTKRADEQWFHRWEIWECPGDDYGMVCQDFNSPDSRAGALYTFVIGEMIGPEAESVIDFVEDEAPGYVYRETYIPIPGPNSNTFIQWLLDQSGWGMKLEPCAIGARWQPRGGWPAV